MIGPLLARLPHRVVIVAGKGGVGKTTTAGAIALALADGGEPTHLISTDPAHSLADLFEELPQACSERLVVEEFDARAYADAFFRRTRPALVTLIEAGSWFDATDAAEFLDLSVPGIDEVMGSLRLVDLVRAGPARIVVDTAPTGHTLRLLESGRILRTWVAAGRAMAEKGGVLASRLMRQNVRFPAEDALDEIEAYAAAFDELLGAAAFVVVTRSGGVVAAETRRLEDSLRARGTHVATRITDRPPAGDAMTFVAARLRVATGCNGLREWAARLDEGDAVAADAARQRPRRTGDVARDLARLGPRFVWVAGKGGVGKSTCAAALATLFAESRSVRIASTDPAGSLSELFGVAVGDERARILPNLHAYQIDAPARFTKMRDDYRSAVESVFAAIGLERAAQLDRNVMEALFDFAPPGIDEIIALIEVMEHAAEYDVTIIDSAPTGHFLRLLEMPAIALEWVHAVMRVLVKYHALASLDALGRDLLAFSKRLRQLKLDLSTPETTAVFVVSLAEPMVTAETQRLCAALERAHIPVAAIILNRADAGSARELRAAHAPLPIICAPDAGTEVIGASELRDFLTQWEKLG